MLENSPSGVTKNSNKNSAVASDYSLPVKDGGLVFRPVSLLTLSAFFAFGKH